MPNLPAAPGPAIVVTASPNWHPGIVGLLASRLKDHAHRPAFAIAFNANGVGTGSGRSVPGFDLGRLVREAADRGLIVKGGGHAMAAGITVERDKLGALRAFFEERAAADVFRLQDEATLQIDAALAAEGATLALLDALEKAGPFGAGHVAPVFVLPRHALVGRPAGRRQPHPRRPAVRERRPHPGDGVPRGRYRRSANSCSRTAARRSMSPGRCREITGTAAARCSFASSTRRWPADGG